MAEVANNEQTTKGRPARKFPRIDMTPMVDLAFLLLTFFVLTSNLQKPTATEIVMPTDGPPMEVDNDLTQTILIDGNADGNVFVYSGFFKSENGFKEFQLNDNSLRKFIAEVNAGIQSQFNYLNTAYHATNFTQENYDRLEQYLRVATAAKDGENEVVKNDKAVKYTQCVAAMETDLKSGTMSDATFKAVGATLRGADNAPFFIVKWGGEAKYGEVISVIDELKIGQVSKYAVTTISGMETEALMHH